MMRVISGPRHDRGEKRLKMSQRKEEGKLSIAAIGPPRKKVSAFQHCVGSEDVGRGGAGAVMGSRT